MASSSFLFFPLRVSLRCLKTKWELHQKGTPVSSLPPEAFLWSNIAFAKEGLRHFFFFFLLTMCLGSHSFGRLPPFEPLFGLLASGLCRRARHTPSLFFFPLDLGLDEPPFSFLFMTDPSFSFSLSDFPQPEGRSKSFLSPFFP